MVGRGPSLFTTEIFIRQIYSKVLLDPMIVNGQKVTSTRGLPRYRMLFANLIDETTTYCPGNGLYFGKVNLLVGLREYYTIIAL